MAKNKNLVYDVEEKPKLSFSLLLAIQHVFAMFGATILVPLLVNKLAGQVILTVPVALLTSGIGTLIYILCTRGKSPVYLGSSFAFIPPMVAAAALGGKGPVFTGIMCVGLAYVLVAIIIKICGKKWIDKILPPLVVGPMIMIIGLGLAPTAISYIGIDGTETINWANVVVALVTFLVAALVALKAKGFFKVIPFLIGIVAGYIVAICFGMVDFKVVLEAAWFSLPEVSIPFVHYQLSFKAVLTILPVILVTIPEHIGDHTVLGTIIDRDLLKEPGLDKTLLGDGLATFAAGLLGGPANTTYGENTSVVGMTKVASVRVLKIAALISICFAFLGKMSAILSTIPNPVLGGACLLLYGFIAVNGLRVIVENKIDFSKTRNVIITSAMLVLGLGGATLGISTGNLSISISGMSLAAIVGILLNSFLPKKVD